MAITADQRNPSMRTEEHATPDGSPAVALLASQVVEIKDGDPLAPVTVVVASNYVAVAARRTLAARPGGIANVSFLPLQRLPNDSAPPRSRPPALPPRAVWIEFHHCCLGVA